jgi:hypothetical protein
MKLPSVIGREVDIAGHIPDGASLKTDAFACDQARNPVGLCALPVHNGKKPTPVLVTRDSS